MISSKRSGNFGLIREFNSVLFGRREKTLEQCDGRVEHNTTFATVLDTSVDLIEVDKVGTNVVDVVVRGLLEIFLAQLRAEREGLNLHVTVRDEMIVDARWNTSPKGVESVWELSYVMASWW